MGVLVGLALYNWNWEPRERNSQVGACRDADTPGHLRKVKRSPRQTVVIAADNQDTPAEGSGTPEVSSKPHERFLRLLLLDELGTAIPEVLIRAMPIVGARHLPSQEFRADNDGQLLIAAPSDTIAVEISISDPVWHADLRKVSLAGSLTEQTVVVHRLITVEFHIEYDDGVPFTGRVSDAKGQLLPPRTSTMDERGGKRSSGGGFLVTANPAVVPFVSPRDTTLNIYCERAGYPRYDHPLSKAELFEGARIHITIPKPKRALGAVVLVFAPEAFEGSTRSWRYRLVPDDYRGSEESKLMNDRPTDHRLFLNEIIPGWYTILVTLDDLVWSAHFEVVVDSVAQLLVELAPQASVQVTLLDEQGTPLSSGCLHIESGVHQDHPVKALPGVRAAAGPDGEAVLGGLAASVREVIVEANGYEPQRLAVGLQAGRTTNIGQIKLVKATGRIELRVVSMAEGVSYSAMCIHPWGRGGRSTRTPVTSSGVVVFSGLPMRDYLVAVHRKEGGAVLSRNVSLTSNQREAVVELDLSTLDDR